MNDARPTTPVGRLVVLTGAGGDIGRAVAIRLASEGWRLALVDRDEAALQRVLDEVLGTDAVAGKDAVLRGSSAGEGANGTLSGSDLARVFPCDVSDEASVGELASSVRATMGATSALVNNAGIGGVGTPIEAMDLAAWSTMISVDLTSVFLTCRAFGPDLKDDGAGRVVNLGSISAEIGVAGSTAYTAAKGGVVAFSKSLAREWAPSQVTVNVVAPGVIDTKMARRRGIDHQRHLIPWPRIGRPDDVAGAVAYLLSSDAEFMTGQVLHLNGGASM